jgi:hypothetical protein
MPWGVDLRAPIWRALAVSLGLHALVALLIPPLSQSSSEQAVETITFVRVSHITIVPKPTPTPLPARAAAGRRESLPPVVVNVPRTIATPAPQEHPLASPVPAPVATAETAAPSQAQSAQAGVAQVGSTAAPQPSVTPTPEVVSATNGRPAGFMPFGAEEHDPVLDPNVLKQLLALGTHVTVTVVVGEDGRSKSVQFDHPIDPQLQARIQTLLADANWDPAVCGAGIACERRATIKL